jgi:hypothetical protein
MFPRATPKLATLQRALEPLEDGRRRFVCFVGAAQNQQKRNACFAWRNQAFRIPGPKIEIIMHAESAFLWIVCFQ